MITEYANSPTHPSVTMVFGGKNKRDKFFASHMKGMPGIKLVPIEGFVGHGAFTESVTRRLFPDLLDMLFGGKPVTKAAS
jgi:hypothetical protein